jgi:hypothetical protein
MYAPVRFRSRLDILTHMMRIASHSPTSPTNVHKHHHTSSRSDEQHVYECEVCTSHAMVCVSISRRLVERTGAYICTTAHLRLHIQLCHILSFGISIKCLVLSRCYAISVAFLLQSALHIMQEPGVRQYCDCKTLPTTLPLRSHTKSDNSPILTYMHTYSHIYTQTQDTELSHCCACQLDPYRSDSRYDS